MNKGMKLEKYADNISNGQLLPTLVTTAQHTDTSN